MTFLRRDFRKAEADTAHFLRKPAKSREFFRACLRYRAIGVVSLCVGQFAASYPTWPGFGQDLGFERHFHLFGVRTELLRFSINGRHR